MLSFSLYITSVQIVQCKSSDVGWMGWQAKTSNYTGSYTAALLNFTIIKLINSELPWKLSLFVITLVFICLSVLFKSKSIYKKKKKNDTKSSRNTQGKYDSVDTWKELKYQ